MVDQNANSPAPIPHKPLPSGKPSVNEALNQPTVLKAGESMLVVALVLIFLVCCTVSLHLYLRRRKRRRGGVKKKKKGKGEEQPELASQETSKTVHIAELVGTPMCEIGESDPRHEMEDVEVDERHLGTMMLRNESSRIAEIWPCIGLERCETRPLRRRMESIVFFYGSIDCSAPKHMSYRISTQTPNSTMLVGKPQTTVFARSRQAACTRQFEHQQTEV
jgi:hypothetical protein